jgi:hypothetical protein
MGAKMKDWDKNGSNDDDDHEEESDDAREPAQKNTKNRNLQFKNKKIRNL